jgi:hypothetical protein
MNNSRKKKEKRKTWGMLASFSIGKRIMRYKMKLG